MTCKGRDGNIFQKVTGNVTDKVTGYYMEWIKKGKNNGKRSKQSVG